MMIQFKQYSDGAYFYLNSSAIISLHHGYDIHSIETEERDYRGVSYPRRINKVFHKAGTTRVLTSKCDDEGYEVVGSLDDIAEWINKNG